MVRRMLGKLLAGLAGFAALIGIASASSASPPKPDDTKPDDTPPVTGDPKTATERKVRLYAKLRACPQFTEDQRLFMMLVAFGETAGTWKPSAHNDTPSEVQASLNAWNNNATLAAKLVALGHGGADTWAIGSFNFPGRLGPYFGDDMLDIGMPEFASPSFFFDIDAGILSLWCTARKLQQWDAWKNGPRTVGALRIGYYGPGYMDGTPAGLFAERIAKYKQHAVKVGLAPSFVDKQLGEFPPLSAAASILASLRTIP